MAPVPKSTLDYARQMAREGMSQQSATTDESESPTTPDAKDSPNSDSQKPTPSSQAVTGQPGFRVVSQEEWDALGLPTDDVWKTSPVPKRRSGK